MKPGDRIEVLQNFEPYKEYHRGGLLYRLVHPKVVGYWIIKTVK